MKSTCRAAFAALLGIGVVGALPAHAQIFGAGESNEQSNPLVPDPKPSPRTRASAFLGYIPFATFASGGSYVPGIPGNSFPGVQGTQTNLGQLVEGDLTFHFNNPMTGTGPTAPDSAAGTGQRAVATCIRFMDAFSPPSNSVFRRPI